MNPRILQLASLLGMLVLVAGVGTDVALAQNQANPRPASTARTLADVRKQIDDLNKRVQTIVYDSDRLDAWIRLGEAREAELRDLRRVAVVEDGKPTVFMDRSAVRQSLLRHVTQAIIEAAGAGDVNKLSLAADAGLLKEMVARLEEDVLRESETFRQKLAADLVAQRARAGRLDESMNRAWRQINELELRVAELKWAELDRGGVVRESLDTQAFFTNLPRVSSGFKEWLGMELDRIRTAGNWSADHHFQVGTLIGVAKTNEELDLTNTLMKKYAACYNTKNLRRAAVLANARAGMYASPGDRIAALDEITGEFNACIGKAEADFRAARGR